MLKLRYKPHLLHPFEDLVIGDVHRMEDGIGADEERQVLVKDIRHGVDEGCAGETFADHKAVFLQQLLFAGREQVFKIDAVGVEGAAPVEGDGGLEAAGGIARRQPGGGEAPGFSEKPAVAFNRKTAALGQQGGA